MIQFGRFVFAQDLISFNTAMDTCTGSQRWEVVLQLLEDACHCWVSQVVDVSPWQGPSATRPPSRPPYRYRRSQCVCAR